MALFFQWNSLKQIDFYFEVIVDSHAVFRNKVVESQEPVAQCPPGVTTLQNSSARSRPGSRWGPSIEAEVSRTTSHPSLTAPSTPALTTSMADIIIYSIIVPHSTSVLLTYPTQIFKKAGKQIQPLQ